MLAVQVARVPEQYSADMNSFVLAMLDRDPGGRMLTFSQFGLGSLMTASLSLSQLSVLISMIGCADTRVLLAGKRPSVQEMLLSRYVKTHMHRFVKERTL